ncbi:HigA family addiction module antitoxin [Raoultibacter massiliensis]|uniref:HigA family addiction module antitoxin n=1 Tax=Raoultibacter massiliensis TaxID=1852371 RepID=A0ABV1JG44_9ACTN|nr:HigA family addiction module antitoxin [Raoultibacter massiliensis]
MNAKEMLLIARRPTHPGEMLREEFMPDFGLSVAALAKRLAVSRQSVNELVHERRAVSADMALRLARVFGTTPQYWSNMQRNVDLWDSLELHSEEIEALEPLSGVAAQ